jgi:hypothetical protein
MGFPPKVFYTVDELSSRWDTPPLKIIEWAMGRKIELVIALPEAEFEDGQEAEYAAVRASQVRPLFRSYADAERFVLICRATPPGAEAPLRIVKPPDGARIMAADVMAVLAEVERFEEENDLVRRVVVGPGAPTRHNWERFYVELCVRIHQHGLPETQKELVEDMQDWIMDDPNWGDPPDESTIRKKVKVIWQRLRPE